MEAGKRIKVANDNAPSAHMALGLNSFKKRSASSHKRASFHELSAPRSALPSTLTSGNISEFPILVDTSNEARLKSDTLKAGFETVTLSGLLISLFALVFALYAFSPLILGSAFSVVVFSTLILCLTDQNWRVQEMTALTLWLTLSLIGLLAFQALGASVFLAGSAGFSIAYLSKTRLPAISGALSLLIFVGSGI
jgi:hypothetical protein